MTATKKSIIKHIKDSRGAYYWQEMSLDEKRADYKNQHSLLNSIGCAFKGNTEVEFVKNNELN